MKIVTFEAGAPDTEFGAASITTRMHRMSTLVMVRPPARERCARGSGRVVRARSGFAPLPRLRSLASRPCPLATGDQFRVHPSSRPGMAGAGLALYDTLGGVFANPSLGHLERGALLRSPSPLWALRRRRRRHHVCLSVSTVAGSRLVRHRRPSPCNSCPSGGGDFVVLPQCGFECPGRLRGCNRSYVPRPPGTSTCSDRSGSSGGRRPRGWRRKYLLCQPHSG